MYMYLYVSTLPLDVPGCWWGRERDTEIRSGPCRKGFRNCRQHNTCTWPTNHTLWTNFPMREVLYMMHLSRFLYIRMSFPEYAFPPSASLTITLDVRTLNMILRVCAHECVPHIQYMYVYMYMHMYLCSIHRITTQCLRQNNMYTYSYMYRCTCTCVMYYVHVHTYIITLHRGEWEAGARITSDSWCLQ